MAKRPTLKKPQKTYIFAKPGTTIRPGAKEPTLMKVRNLLTMRHIPPYGAKIELVTDVRRQLLKKDLVKISEAEFKDGMKAWDARVAAEKKKADKSESKADKDAAKAQAKADKAAAEEAARTQAKAEKNEPTKA